MNDESCYKQKLVASAERAHRKYDFFMKVFLIASHGSTDWEYLYPTSYGGL